MEIIKWRESYETGIPSMDQQHRVLIDLINQLYTMMREKSSEDELGSILQRCLDYGEEHLQTEEALLEQHGYPEMEQHIAHHQKFFKTIEDLKQQYGEQEGEVTPEIYKFLRTWWIDHIVAEDKKYGPYLKEKGVE